MYGFINNSLDYKKYVLKPKYGAFSLFTVPTATVAVFGTVIMAIFAIIGIIEGIYHLTQKMMATNFYVSAPAAPHLNLFFFDASPLSLIMILLYAMLVTTVLIGQKMRAKRPIPTISLLYFVAIYTVMSPLWLLKATYNTIAGRQTAWR
jgi:hypothetical protein